MSSEIYDKSPAANTNQNYNIILDEINQAKHKYMTSELVIFNKYKHKKSIWKNQCVLTSILPRDKFYKQIKLTNPDSPEYELLLIKLKTYSVMLKKKL